MNEPSRSSLEERSRALFSDSVDNIDMRMRSRLTQARSAAIDAASHRWRRFFRVQLWAPVVGVSAAAVLGAVLWFGHGQTATENASTFEDLEIVASTDEASTDEMELLQDDIEFYDWADKGANPDSGSVG
jgi:hypothetical protein